MMSVIKKSIELPEKIQNTLLSEGLFSESFFCLKTDFKPNATIPIVWLVATESHVLLCNTHRLRGIYEKYLWVDINEVRKKKLIGGRLAIEIIFCNLGADTQTFVLANQYQDDEVNQFINGCITLKQGKT